MGILGDILGGVGTVLDMPRRGLYGLGNALYKGATGDTGPDIEHFSDILQRAGLDKDSALTQGLGFLGDMATDPLTYAGGALARGALKGLGGADLALGKAAASGEGLAAAKNLKPARVGISKFTGIHDIPADMAHGLDETGAVTDAAKDLFEGSDLMEMSPAFGGQDDRVLKGYFRSGLPGTGDDVNAINDRFEQMAGGLRSLNGGSAEGLRINGAYHPSSSSVGITANGMRTPEKAVATTRHEMVHGMIDQAARNPDPSVAANLPFLMRLPAQLQRASGHDVGKFLGGAGEIGNELAAQALESRTLGQQAKSALGFLLDPAYNAQYVKNFANMGVNPLALKVYSSLPMTATALAGAAPHSGSSLLQQLGE